MFYVIPLHLLLLHMVRRYIVLTLLICSYCIAALYLSLENIYIVHHHITYIAYEVQFFLLWVMHGQSFHLFFLYLCTVCRSTSICWVMTYSSPLCCCLDRTAGLPTCLYTSLPVQEYQYMLGDDLLVAPVLLPGQDSWPTYLYTFLPVQEYEYMLGDDLLVAPVLLPGQDSWPVYLPGSADLTWVHLWSGEVAGTGGQMVMVAAPLGEPPVFYRADSAWSELFQAIGQEFRLPPKST
jgi:hypothetical protein